MPCKPMKYGIKILWLFERVSGFSLNAKIYTGKEENQVYRGLARDVVMELCSPFYGSGRDIVTDNYFTSHELAVKLLEKNLKLLGTIRSHRKEVPRILTNNNRPIQWITFVYDHANKIMLASYIPKKNKNVILLSLSHSGNRVIPECANKPELILDYNFGKKGVDQFDQNIEEFTCCRKTKRWPLLLF
jgi:hypothetical protein